jgi:hypothetical protein
MVERNAILSSLPESDAASIRPHLKFVHLPQKTVLFEAGSSINAVYFPITAVATRCRDAPTPGCKFTSNSLRRLDNDRQEQETRCC